jgi:uncharacterized protein YndB with AHSA1/START domain
MFKKIGLALLTGIVIFLGYVALKSPEYVVSRQITIDAPAENIFPYLNHSKLAQKWGPWMEIDPQAKMTYSGPDAGVGARTSWTGGKQLGTGSATIIESVPNQRVGVRLEYEEPMPMTQKSEYLIQASGSRSVVTWKVQGANSFLGRLMCTFMNMDKMVGGMFEKGLSNLKTLVEGQPKAKNF